MVHCLLALGQSQDAENWDCAHKAVIVAFDKVSLEGPTFLLVVTDRILSISLIDPGSRIDIYIFIYISEEKVYF